MALLGEADLLGENPRAQPAHRICDDQRSQLAAGEHIVAQRNLLVHYLVQHPLVYPFIMPTEDKNMLILPQLQRLLLAEGLPFGRHIDDVRAGFGHGAHRLEAIIDRHGLHQHPLAPAVGGVIHPAVLVLGVVADVVAVDFQLAGLSGPADDALPQHRLAHLGEEGGNINPHRQTAPPAGGSSSRRRPDRPQ